MGDYEGPEEKGPKGTNGGSKKNMTQCGTCRRPYNIKKAEGGICPRCRESFRGLVGGKVEQPEG